MLSQDTLDELIQPIIDRQESINNFVVGKIADRINEIGKIKTSDVKRLLQLRQVGGDVQLINRELAVLTSLQVNDIKQVIRVAAQAAYLDAKPFYDYRHKSFIPYKDNKYLQREVEAIARQTGDTYRNISKAQAFMIRDPKNPKKLLPTSIAKTYQSIIDEAVQASQTGVLDYNTAMRRSLKQLADSGLRRVTYHPESGRVYTQRMDTAVRRNIQDGIRQVNQKVDDITGEEFGADGKELSVHAYSAPDHEPIQGLQFTLKNWEKLNSQEPFQSYEADGQSKKSFGAIDRAIGTWNCRHFARSIILGVMKPNFTDKQLQALKDANEKGYNLPNGKHLKMYECTQYQRKLETEIRYAKDGQIAARAAGDMDLARYYQRKINKYTNEYRVFSNDCGLPQMKTKMTVSGYSKIKTNP